MVQIFFCVCIQNVYSVSWLTWLYTKYIFHFCFQVWEKCVGNSRQIGQSKTISAQGSIGIIRRYVPRYICTIRLWNRYGLRFFVRVEHETTYAFSGNKHFFAKQCHRQTYQNYEQSRQKLGNLEIKILHGFDQIFNTEIFF